MAPCQTTVPVGESLWITTLWGIPASLLVNVIWKGTPAGAVRSVLSNAMPEAVSSRTVPVAPPDAAGEAAALPEGAALGAPLGAPLAAPLGAADGAAEEAPLAAALGGGVGANVHPGCAPEHATRTVATRPMRATA